MLNGRLPQGVAGASGVGLDGSGRNEPGTDFVASITWRSLSTRGGSPAVTFLDGTPQETSASFNSHVNSVVRRTAGRLGRVAPLARLAPMARMVL
ncbi:hypothetical protein [Paludisphaera soli]|uniref:hypothetical protein n=1 Tax=Paludisphaera soli TaxID=2712865 RepID=UPI0013E9FC27|nr:hypothetical protein [Paludisphaera soli]